MTDNAERVARKVRLVIEMDVEVYDPTWDDTTLVDNAVCWLEAALDHQRDRDRRYTATHPDEDADAYDAPDPDMQVWPNRAAYLADAVQHIDGSVK